MCLDVACLKTSVRAASHRALHFPAQRGGARVSGSQPNEREAMYSPSTSSKWVFACRARSDLRLSSKPHSSQIAAAVEGVVEDVEATRGIAIGATTTSRAGGRLRTVGETSLRARWAPAASRGRHTYTRGRAGVGQRLGLRFNILTKGRRATPLG